MAYKGFRPDLFNRIQNKIVMGTFPRQRFTAEELGDSSGSPRGKSWSASRAWCRLAGVNL